MTVVATEEVQELLELGSDGLWQEIKDAARHGKIVRYAMADVIAWEQEHLVRD